MWTLSSLVRIEPPTPALEGEVLTSGPPGTSQLQLFSFYLKPLPLLPDNLPCSLRHSWYVFPPMNCFLFILSFLHWSLFFLAIILACPQTLCQCDFHAPVLKRPHSFSYRVDFLRTKVMSRKLLQPCSLASCWTLTTSDLTGGIWPVQFIEGVNLFVVQSEACVSSLPRACFIAYAAGLQPNSWVWHFLSRDLTAALPTSALLATFQDGFSVPYMFMASSSFPLPSPVLESCLFLS